MQRTTVLYHANCWDGFCAAWIARRSLGQEADYVPVQYNQGPPAIAPGGRVYILDFSYDREVLAGLAAGAASLVVLDHHKTASEELAGLALPGADIVFDMGKSGARLTWEHFRPGAAAPWLVDYTEDRDLWRWRLPDSEAVNAALRSYPLDFATWDWLEGADLGTLVAEGKAILRRERQIVDEHVANAEEVEIDGHRVLAVNATVLISEIGNRLCQGRPFAACYFYRGGVQKWSLRSTDAGEDVSKVAKRRGGGGHRNAAGYEVKLAA